MPIDVVPSVGGPDRSVRRETSRPRKATVAKRITRLINLPGGNKLVKDTRTDEQGKHLLYPKNRLVTPSCDNL